MSPKVRNDGIVISILLFQVIKIPAVPIHNGFTVKFSPGAPKEDIKPKTFGSLFAKTSQGLTPQAQKLSQTILTQGLGCTNHIARHFAIESNLYNTSEDRKMDMLTIPILKELNETYKIIVVKAPKGFRIGKRDSEQAIIYILFSDEDTEEFHIPEVYFVKKSPSDVLDSKIVDPVIIVNNNRTITRLRSADITKFVRFKSKRNNRHESQEVIKR
ncbi:uncharacterized protein LOC121738709 [Aricia agestis]|uniref:uncharacterized protein LOC121738709 n=1 Tax=Aricia agestis TaxID=91739 RepID=UPI001C208D11|nr:uncharacterized protein LOC121738709 [Aricia agestis]